MSTCLFISLAGCNISEDKTAAEEVTKIYFDGIMNKEYDKVLDAYSDLFFEETKSEDWIDMLKAINRKLGDLKSYNLKGWKINKYFGTSNSGTYYDLTYEVEYSKYTAVESIRLFKPKGKEEIKIIGHNISSDGLIKE